MQLILLFSCKITNYLMHPTINWAGHFHLYNFTWLPLHLFCFYGFRHSLKHCPPSSILLVGWLISGFPSFDRSSKPTTNTTTSTKVASLLKNRWLDCLLFWIYHEASTTGIGIGYSLASFIGIKKLANFNPDCLNVFVLSCHGRQSLPIVSALVLPSSSFAAWCRVVL